MCVCICKYIMHVNEKETKEKAHTLICRIIAKKVEPNYNFCHLFKHSKEGCSMLYLYKYYLYLLLL